MTGMKQARETEKLEKTIPSHRPFAPMLSAYIGRNGTIIPAPRTEVAMAMERITRVSLFFTRDFLPVLFRFVNRIPY
jgi:hypothetical protein